MGDRCHMIVAVHKDHVDKFREATDLSLQTDREMDDVVGDGHPEFDLYEVNYGAYEGRIQAARDGCVFYGWHGSCTGAYNGCHFAAIDGEMFEALCTDGDHDALIVGVDANGNPNPQDVEDVKKYIEAEKKVKARLGIPILSPILEVKDG